MKNVVISKFYDDGKVRVKIKSMPGKDAKRLTKIVFTDEYDLYCDVFDTLEEAEKFYRNLQ